VRHTAAAAAAPKAAPPHTAPAKAAPHQEPTTSIAVYAISDLHTDHAANLRWVEELPAPPALPGRTNILLVAGDISHDLRLLRRTLTLLRTRYDRVFFVWGNHEAWLKGAPEVNGGARDSLAKLHAVHALCAELGVATAPQRFGRLWIVPVLSWHHKVR